MDGRFYSLIRQTSELTKMVTEAVEFADIHQQSRDYLDSMYNDLRGAIEDSQAIIQQVIDDEFRVFMESLKP